MSDIVLEATMIVECTAWSLVAGQYMANVFHFDILATAGASATDTDFAAAFDSLMAPHYKNILSTAAQYYGSKTQIIVPVRYDPVIVVENRGAGILTGDQLPTQACGVVSWKTGFAKRTQFGRSYFPAATEAQNDSVASPGSGYLSALNDLAGGLRAFDDITDGGDAVTFALSVFSKKTGELTPINLHIVRDEWGTQRRRSQLGKGDTAPF